MNSLREETKRLAAALSAWPERYPDVRIYSEGMVSLSVCSSMPQAEVEAALAEYPSGTEHGWRIAEEDHFGAGGPMPGPCEQDSASRHYLFHC